MKTQHLIFNTQAFEVRRRQDCQIDQPACGLQTQSCLRLFQTYYKIFDYYHLQGEKKPVCFMSNESLMSPHWANMSHTTFMKAKKKLVQLGLIDIRSEETWKCGKIAYVWPTDVGWAKYLEIRVEHKKPRKGTKEKEFSYTEQDMKNAKTWFGALRKHWQGYKGKLATIGTWKETANARSNAARLARERVNLNAEAFGEVLKTILSSSKADFFLQNVLGVNSFMKRWKNEKTVAENLVLACDEIHKQEELRLSKQDVPTYVSEDGTVEEDSQVSHVWNYMWDLLGKRLRTKFLSSSAKKEYRDSLIDLCEELADRLYLRPGRINLRNPKLRAALWNEPQANEASYFYFLLDKYESWSGYFSVKMMWSAWMDFWTRVWKLDHANILYADLEQFRVKQLEGDER